MHDLKIFDDQMFYSVVQSINSAVILHDRQLQVVFVNDVFEAIFDIPKKEALGKSPMEFLPDFDETHRKAIQNRLKKTLDTGRKSPYHEFTYFSPAGNLRYLLALSMPVFNTSKEISHVMSLIHDVTLKNELEQEKLKGAKLTSLADMAYTLAHEINNPLTGIKLGLNSLYKGLERSENIQLLDSVMKDLNRIQTTVNQFLKEKKNETKLKKNMTGVIDEILEDVLFHLSRQLDLRHIAVKKVFFSRNLPILIDREKLHEVFLNLILNAIEAIADKGRVTIKTDIVSSKNNPTEALRVSISDTGEGIDGASLSQVFNRFYTSKKDGTGLGLSICRRHIEKHGGRIELKSRKGIGTTATIHLPIAGGTR